MSQVALSPNSNAPAHAAPAPDELEGTLDRALDALLATQRPDGHWVFELEADATIPAEYVLLVHYLGETPDTVLEARIARYLRRIRMPMAAGRCSIRAARTSAPA